MPRQRTVRQVEKDALACQLRRDNKSYREIAVILGYSGESGAYAAVKRGMRDIIAEAAEAVRDMDLARLDRYASVALGILETDHYAHSGGKLIRHPETGEYLLDDGPRLAAIDRLVKIVNTRADILGYKMPIKIDATVASVDPVDEELRRLVEQHRSRVEVAERALKDDHAGD